MEKREPSYTVGGNANWYSHYGEQCGDSLKTWEYPWLIHVNVWQKPPQYCKLCCDEHWGTCVSFNSGFLGVYAQQWDYWVIWQFYFQFFKESPHCSP